jgi:hypothetical protein
MPFYVYAVAADGADLDALASKLTEKLAALVAKPVTKGELFSLRVQIAQRAHMADAVDAAYLAAAEARLVKQGWEQKAAHTQVIGQLAIELGIVEHLYGSDCEKLLERLNAIGAEDFQALLGRVLAPEHRITTLLVPHPEGR